MTIGLSENPFRSRLRAGPCQIGVWSSLGSPAVAEMLALAGFDWVALDTEHGPADPLTTMGQLQAVAAAGGVACVRIASNDAVLAKKAIDIGATTIIVPQVESAEQARMAVAHTRFPPRGARGVSTTARGSFYGLVPGFHRNPHAEAFPVLMIESARAIGALAEIVAVDGADAFLFGPQDLAADMGFLAEPGAPKVVAAMEKGVDMIVAAGKFPGVAVGSVEDAARWMERGVRFVTCGSDVGLVGRGAQSLAQAALARRAGGR